MDHNPNDPITQIQSKVVNAIQYPPYATAAKNDGAYARYVSADHPRMLPPNLNIKLGRREGNRVEDAYTGRWYWDCWRQGSKFNLGHRPPKLVQAWKESIDYVDGGSWAQLSGYRARLAEMLAATTGGLLTGAVYGCSGSDGTEIALHTARKITGRDKFVAIARVGYHGATDLGLSVSGFSGSKQAQYRVDTSNTSFVPWGDLDAMVAAINDQTAAVIMEPSPAQAGFPNPPEGYFAGIREACDHHGTLLVIDEVQTGLGSPGGGHFWGFQAIGVEPDIMFTGKGLGGGLYGISVAMMRDDIHLQLCEGLMIPHEGTYAGTDLGCIIAAAVIEMTNDLLPQIKANSQRYFEAFAEAGIATQGFGSTMGLLVENPIQAFSELVDAGVLVIPSIVEPAIPFRPTLTQTPDEVEQVIAIVTGVLKR